MAMTGTHRGFGGGDLLQHFSHAVTVTASDGGFLGDCLSFKILKEIRGYILLTSW